MLYGCVVRGVLQNTDTLYDCAWRDSFTVLTSCCRRGREGQLTLHCHDQSDDLRKDG